MEQPLGQVRRRFALLHAVVRRMDRQPVAAAGHSRHLRHLHIEIHVSPVLAQTQGAQANQQNLPQSVGMGRSDRVRYGRGDADPHLCVRYVRHSDSVDGKKPARGRLSAREQTGIRSGDAQYAAVVPARTQHAASVANEKVVRRMDQVALPPAIGVGARQAQRSGRVQFSGRRHGGADGALGQLLRPAAAVSAGLRRESRTRHAVAADRGRVPSGRQARQLREALHRSARRHDPDRALGGMGQQRAAARDTRQAVQLLRADRRHDDQSGTVRPNGNCAERHTVRRGNLLSAADRRERRAPAETAQRAGNRPLRGDRSRSRYLPEQRVVPVERR